MAKNKQLKKIDLVTLNEAASMKSRTRATFIPGVQGFVCRSPFGGYIAFSISC